MFSAFQHNPECPTENTARQSSSYSSGTLLDHTELVPGTLGDAGRSPSNNDSLIEHIVSPYPPNNTPPSASQVKPSSGSHIWGNIESQNVSKTTQYILLSSWRKSTRGRYNSVLQQWNDFCGREETNYLLPDATSVPKFFTELYEKGCQYSSIALARSALAFGVTVRGYATLSDHPLIKGVFHLRPPKPKYSSIWDADILLKYWQKIEDNSQLNLLELSKKVTTLLLLLHGLRISTIATFDVTLITMSNDTCIFYRSELLKPDRQGRPRDKFIYKKFENSKLCPMAATKKYLKRRAE